MAITTIADLQIVPNKFAQYVTEEMTKKSALIRSGVATSDPTIAQLINGAPKGGNKIQLPFYKNLSGDDDVFGEEEMSAKGIDTGIEDATLLIRQKAWGDTDLARVFGGTDPLGAISGMVADYWIDKEQMVLVNVLNGLFSGASCSLKSHILDVSASEGTDCIIGVDNTLDAKQLMGDAANKLGVVAMHSATYTQLQKQNNIETVYDSDLKVNIQTYLGYQVLVDDDMPVKAGVYDTYFLGKGAFALENGTPQGLVPVETMRKALSSSNYLITRRAFILHPHGVSFTAATSTFADGKKYASNADLAKAANWAASKEMKNIPIVCLRHKLVANAAKA